MSGLETGSFPVHVPSRPSQTQTERSIGAFHILTRLSETQIWSRHFHSLNLSVLHLALRVKTKLWTRQARFTIQPFSLHFHSVGQQNFPSHIHCGLLGSVDMYSSPFLFLDCIAHHSATSVPISPPDFQSPDHSSGLHQSSLLCGTFLGLSCRAIHVLLCALFSSVHCNTSRVVQWCVSLSSLLAVCLLRTYFTYF